LANRKCDLTIGFTEDTIVAELTKEIYLVEKFPKAGRIFVGVKIVKA